MENRPELFELVPLVVPLILTDAYGNALPFSSVITPDIFPAFDNKDDNMKKEKSKVGLMPKINETKILLWMLQKREY